ncbi:unnamed protein product [Closterium sp. NIES-54]
MTDYSYAAYLVPLRDCKGREVQATVHDRVIEPGGLAGGGWHVVQMGRERVSQEHEHAAGNCVWFVDQVADERPRCEQRERACEWRGGGEEGEEDMSREGREGRGTSRGEEQKGKEQKGEEQKGKEKKREEQKGKEQKREEQKGKEQKREEQKGRSKKGRSRRGRSKKGRSRRGRSKKGRSRRGRSRATGFK